MKILGTQGVLQVWDEDFGEGGDKGDLGVHLGMPERGPMTCDHPKRHFFKKLPLFQPVQYKKPFRQLKPPSLQGQAISSHPSHNSYERNPLRPLSSSLLEGIIPALCTRAQRCSGGDSPLSSP